MLILGVEHNPKGEMPWVTWTLIGVNLLAFGIQVRVGDPINYGFSLVPAEITSGKDLVKPQKIKVKVPVPVDPRTRARGRVRHQEHWVSIPQHPGPFPIHLTLLTSMFLHGGWLHLIGNMWFLFVFGGQIENALRPGLYLAFYLFCGVAAGLAHVLSDPHSVIPCLGASGAISGVMGAYFRLFPHHKVKLWFGWAIGIIEVPAAAVLGVWFLLQYTSGEAAVTSGEVQGGVAYWAHIGGFVAGLGFVALLILYLKARAAEMARAAAAAAGEAAPTAATGQTGEAHPEQIGTPVAAEPALPPSVYDNFLPARREKASGKDPWR
jgi:membrane associated rhomboid family serine protease